jgi:signal transduction histidine kinase
MNKIFDSFKGRVALILVVFLSLSHLFGLWLYAGRSESATTLLHDALLAERVALVSRLVERIPFSQRPAFLELVSDPLMRFWQTPEAPRGQDLREGSRPHLFEHLLSVFLNRTVHQGVRVTYAESKGDRGLISVLAAVNGSLPADIGHLPSTPLAEILPVGKVTTEVRLGDGSWLGSTAPLLSISPFSPWKIGGALSAMLASVLVVAVWILHRWTQPLSLFASAAERLGTDIHAPRLIEEGPSEVRTAAHAFNVMQDRIRRLVQDRIAVSAAIAHDLGTPITRLHLKAEEIGDAEVRASMLADLDQMRRMITATLEFARLDFSAEAPEVFDLMSLVQRVSDDLIDLGHDVLFTGSANLAVRSKPIAVRRALANIVENAVKYGKRARIEVKPRGNLIEIAVDDDGPGIPESLQAEAFEPFRRLPMSGDAAVAGTGLGLTIARNTMRGLGGDVSLCNRAEGGLRVSVSVPAHRGRGA